MKARLRHEKLPGNFCARNPLDFFASRKSACQCKRSIEPCPSGQGGTLAADFRDVRQGVNLCRFLHFSCFGCCGYSFKGKKLAAESLISQTKEFEQYKGSKLRLIDFRERTRFDDLNKCSFCRNLVLKEKLSSDECMKRKTLEVICPLHPALNKRIDLRSGHCDIRHMCGMQIFFHSQDERARKRLADWLKNRIKKDDIDWYTYSIYMDTDVFLKEYK